MGKIPREMNDVGSTLHMFDTTCNLKSKTDHIERTIWFHIIELQVALQAFILRHLQVQMTMTNIKALYLQRYA